MVAENYDYEYEHKPVLQIRFEFALFVTYWPLTEPSIRDFSQQDAQMIYADAGVRVEESFGVRVSWVSASLESTADIWLSTYSRKVEMLSGALAWYGQEKKLRVNIAVCFPLSVSLSLTTEALTPRRIKSLYIFYEEVLCFFLHHGI